MKEFEIKLLASFFPHIDNIYTARDIEKFSGYSHERVFTFLKTLENSGKVARRSLGRTNIYRIKRSPELFLPYAYYNESRKSTLLKNPLLREKISKAAFPEKGCTIFLRNKLISVPSAEELEKLAASKEFLDEAVVIYGAEFFFRRVYCSEVMPNELFV